MGYSDIDNMSVRSVVPTGAARQIALMNLKPSRDMRENSREFVIRSRDILLKEISIANKKEETMKYEHNLLI